MQRYHCQAHAYLYINMGYIQRVVSSRWIFFSEPSVAQLNCWREKQKPVKINTVHAYAHFHIYIKYNSKWRQRQWQWRRRWRRRQHFHFVSFVYSSSSFNSMKSCEWKCVVFRSVYTGRFQHIFIFFLHCNFDWWNQPKNFNKIPYWKVWWKKERLPETAHGACVQASLLTSKKINCLLMLARYKYKFHSFSTAALCISDIIWIIMGWFCFFSL